MRGSRTGKRTEEGEYEEDSKACMNYTRLPSETQSQGNFQFQLYTTAAVEKREIKILFPGLNLRLVPPACLCKLSPNSQQIRCYLFQVSSYAMSRGTNGETRVEEEADVASG